MRCEKKVNEAAAAQWANRRSRTRWRVPPTRRAIWCAAWSRWISGCGTGPRTVQRRPERSAKRPAGTQTASKASKGNRRGRGQQGQSGQQGQRRDSKASGVPTVSRASRAVRPNSGGSPNGPGGYGDARNWGGYGYGRWDPNDIRQWRGEYRNWANDADAAAPAAAGGRNAGPRARRHHSRPADVRATIGCSPIHRAWKNCRRPRSIV